jgi:hypothetical protein
MPKPGSTAARGYGAKHKAERKRWEPQVNAGLVNCWRCGWLIAPGQPWDLGHDDYDRSVWRGPEHRHSRHCPAGGNRRAGAIKGNKMRGARRRGQVNEQRRWRL